MQMVIGREQIREDPKTEGGVDGWGGVVGFFVFRYVNVNATRRRAFKAQIR
jgi:hypothetical protein